MSEWRHLRAIALLPTTALLVIPGAIVYLTWPVDIGWQLQAPLGLVASVLGGVLIAIGLGLAGWNVALFATAGEGTLAPWDATRRLVVRGPYRHVRNPMITGILCVLLGEAIFLGSLPLFGWLLLFFLANALHIPLSEERGLEQRFGDEYRRYRRNVPRWAPRLRPWRPDLDARPQPK